MHAPVVLALPPFAYASSRLAGEAALRADDRVAAATRLRRLNRVLQATVALVGVFVVTDSRLDDAVAAAIPGPTALSTFGALTGTVVIGGLLPALAVHLGTRPAWAAVTGTATDYVATARRYVTLAALFVAPAFFVVGAWLAAPSGFPGLVAVALAASLLLGGLPPVAARFGPVRRPTREETACVPACADALRVRVVVTDRFPILNAVATGFLPGFRYVFVTDALLETLDDRAVAAVVAHEAGHHNRNHVLGRLAASAAALAPVLLAATGVVDAFVLASVLSAGLLVAIGPLVRWTEFDADAYAARAVGAAAMERALATLADHGLVAVDRPRVVGLLSLHPAIEQRVRRLRDPHGF
jgi:STE24 endopeptidase